jgi:acyl-CoA thioester hydrolase
MSPSRKPAPQTVPVRIESGAGSEASTARAGARANGDKTAGLPVLHSEAARRAKRRDALSAPGPKGERQDGASNGEPRAVKRARTPKGNAVSLSNAADAAPPATTLSPMASVPMSVRWGDLDAFNHVNNATFLVYAQEARLAWLANIDGVWFDETMMPVVAAAQINFRRQLAWPAQVIVELAAKRIGTSSVTITHRIVAAAGHDCVYADGEVVMVWIEPASGRSVPLPAAIRAACQPGSAA